AGLSCAYELARKGYAVVVFEEADGPGGRARELGDRELPAAELATDCAVVMATGADLVPFTRVQLEHPTLPNALAELAPGVDAIFLAMGAAEADAGAALGYELDERGRIAVDPVTLATSKPTIYCGGSILRPDEPWSPITSIADGRRAALSIERQLQKVSLGGSRGDRGAYATNLVVNLSEITSEAPREPVEPARGYARAEAIDEADRCLQCECLECVKACAYLEAFGAHPGLYARRIYNNLTVTMGRGSRSLNRMIDSCSRCRLCYEVCPTDLDMAEVIRDARREMVRQNRMPASAFGFALRDFELATSDQFVLARHAPGTQASEAVFFPGCQLAASDPEGVERIYGHLRERLSPATGLLLGCCGAPADWAGRDDLAEAALVALRAQLESLGGPRLILACTTCETMFAGRLPGVETVSLWEVLRDAGLPAGAAGAAAGRRLAVHDACTARYQTTVQDAVRDVLAACGAEVEELGLSRERTECCGFGGLMLYANPEMGERVAERRTGTSEADFVAHCAMCRDRFAGRGKPTVHLLDLVLGRDYDERARRRGPLLTQRAEQRARLKRRLLADLWGEPTGDGAWRDQLILTAEVEQLLEDRFIRPAEVQQTIAHGEATGRRFVEPATGHLLASHGIGSVTYWVEYSRDGDRFVVHGAYSHRMEIKPPPWIEADTLDDDDGRGWRCAQGDHALAPRVVTLSYLVAGVPVKLPTCLEHGLVLVSEPLATGRMHEVELALEDK
ncbi:MAG TPA: heterodisulfide reductase-related iron-sulfur binding cluster, partial [Thermoleophilia bacterium]|nr:heterodisulfide reductase-related iron-sulfur binding cluster [Thermoleophilia bacterium]